MDCTTRCLPAVFEVGSKIGEFGRGERRQASATDLDVPVPLVLDFALTGVQGWSGHALA